MPARYISYKKFLCVFAQLGAALLQLYVNNNEVKNALCELRGTCCSVLFITLKKI